jgi:hypothetical protein
MLRPRPLILLLASLFLVIACDAPSSTSETGTEDSVPATPADEPEAATSASKTEVSSASDADLPGSLSCEELFATQSATSAFAKGLRCPASDENQPCERGCLSCRCFEGKWQPCTTSASCFADGG